MRLIDADALLAEYDRVHEGLSGGARKLIEDAPEVKPKVVAEVKIDNDALQEMVDKAVEHVKAELFGNSEQLDTISRQAAIDEANAWLLDCLKVQKQDRSCGLIRRLEDLPTAPPTIEPRAKGEWAYGEHDDTMWDGYRCSHCGFFVPWDYSHVFIDFIKDYHFCPSCGADMRGEQDGG